MSDEFLIPDGRQRFHLEIKRSSFITTVNQTPGADAARSFIHSIRDELPDANHHCWAYVAGNPEDVFQIDKSDDGEPRGTAGKPILNVLQHSNLGHASIVVTRYFGGIKLGAGGLVRAYSQCASQAVAALKTSRYIVRETLVIELPYTLVDRVEYFLQGTEVDISARDFQEQVTLTLAVPRTALTKIHKGIKELGQGNISIVDVDSSA